ncbi:MAG: hypothetical protein WCO65_02165 [bacterium]
MDIQELRQFIETSDFTPETKHKISVILAGKAVLDYDTYAGVKEVLQQELDNDFDEAGVGDLSDDPEAQALEDEYESNMEDINTKMQEDLNFVDQETKKLNEINTQVHAMSNETD